MPDRAATALIGPSGCGKSTLIRVLNRLHDMHRDQRAAGEVLLDGEDILGPLTDLNRLRARIGMTFQRAQMLPMSIFENIAFGIRLHHPRVARSELEGRVERALTRAALWGEVRDRLRRSAHDLSGGQQQRLCVARAVALDPEVLLFDEPCSALDPISSAQVEELIVELKRTSCVVIVTHNMQQGARIADVAGFMFMGEMLEVGPASQIFGHAKQDLTRKYVQGYFG